MIQTIIITGLLVYILLDHYYYKKLKNKNKQNYVHKIIERDAKNHLYNTQIPKKTISLVIPKWLKKAARNSKKKRKNPFTVNPIRGLNVVPDNDLRPAGK